MNRSTLALTRPFAALAAAALMLTGCIDRSPLAPQPDAASAAIGTPTLANPKAPTPIDLTGCEQLAAPAGKKLVSRLYAVGVQIYTWNGTAWAFDAPEADLFPNAHANGRVGTHYRGPTWETNSGSKVVAALIDRCPVGANDIPWLLLGASPAGTGPGLFDGVTHIQRVHTKGGVAPSAPGTFVGQVARVGYTADYLFYR